ncbi:MAG: tetratricopeptide repeat protein [Methanobacteriota archaeon]
MESEISRKVAQIMEREMGSAGASIIERQCEQLGLDKENLRPNDLPRLAGRLSELMRVMGGHQKANRIYQEIQKLADLERIAELAPTDDSRLALFEDLAKGSMFSGDWQKAIFYFKKLLHNAEVGKNRSGMAKYLIWIGFVHKEKSSLDQAMTFYERAMRFAESVGDDDQLSHCHYQMGDVLWYTGELDRALESYQKALNLATSIKFKGAAHVGIGNMLMNKHDFPAATGHYREALKLLEGTDDYLDQARAYNNIGDVHLQLKEWDSAVECFDESAELAEKGGWLNVRAFTQFNTADALVHKGDYGKAKEMLEKSMEILLLIDSKSGLAGAHHVYAKLFMALKDYPKVVEHYKAAIEIYELAKIPFYRAQCNYELGKAYIEMGDRERAQGHFHEATRIYGELNLDTMVKKAMDAAGR